MSSDVEKKSYIVPIYDIIKEETLNLNKIIIPFSNFGESRGPIYIYNGNENIPFRKRHLIYQTLLRNEFSDD